MAEQEPAPKKGYQKPEAIKNEQFDLEFLSMGAIGPKAKNFLGKQTPPTDAE